MPIINTGFNFLKDRKSVLRIHGLFVDISANYTALKKNRLELLELKHLLIQADNFLSDPAVQIADLHAEDTTREYLTR